MPSNQEVKVLSGRHKLKGEFEQQHMNNICLSDQKSLSAKINWISAVIFDI